MTTTRAAGRDKPPERRVGEDRVTVARLRRQLDRQGTELAELRTAYAELLATMTQTIDHDENEEPTSHGRHGRSSSTSGGADRQRLENPLLTRLRPPGGRIGRAFWYASLLLMSFAGPWLGFEMIQRAGGNAFDLPFTLFSLGVATVAWVNTWLRIADPSWADPLDPTFARASGQRWNPPNSFPVLYLNGDVVTARLNLRRFIAGWPYEPEDLRDDTGPCLVSARLPRGQCVADVHTQAGVADVALPASYPLDVAGQLVGHEVCQPIGVQAHASGLRGVRCRSARAPHGAGPELAWFPATSRSRARVAGMAMFEAWFYR